MSVIVADTSGLVSLGVAAGDDPDPLVACLSEYDVVLPETVCDELREVAAYDDEHGVAASAVVDRLDDVRTTVVELDETFPLDAGENAAVTLANDSAAALLLCDEFNRLGLIHASLAETRLVTTPTMLAVFVRTAGWASADALACLDAISTVRSWESNSYVQRARALFEES